MKNKEYWIQWGKAAGIRAAKTITETGINYTPEGYFYKEAVYRVSDINNITYYPVQVDTKVEPPKYDGYAGVPGVPIDKLQIWIE